MSKHISTPRTARHGFTLLELLVVISIIALLISILLPSLKQAREVAKMTQCESNLHQFAIGFQMYANDFNGVWPHYSHTHFTTDIINSVNGAGENHWRVIGRCYPYLKTKEIFYCPNDDHNSNYLKYNWSNPTKSYWSSYCVRGPYQTYNYSQKYASNGDQRMSLQLSGVSDRALISCFFMYNSGNSGSRLGFHNAPNYKYPVMFGGGDVQVGELPDSIDSNPPPDIWSHTPKQDHIWDNFDKAR